MVIGQIIIVNFDRNLQLNYSVSDILTNSNADRSVWQDFDRFVLIKLGTGFRVRSHTDSRGTVSVDFKHIAEEITDLN